MWECDFEEAFSERCQLVFLREGMPFFLPMPPRLQREIDSGLGVAVGLCCDLVAKKAVLFSCCKKPYFKWAMCRLVTDCTDITVVMRKRFFYLR